MSDTEYFEGTYEDAKVGFINVVKDYPAVFSKSQTPESRQEKKSSLQNIRHRYAQLYGKDLTEVQIFKKINNMKARLKKKVDKNRTGNVKIVLKDWEKKLLEVMEGDEPNPTLQKIPGAISIGTSDLINVSPEASEDEAEFNFEFVDSQVGTASEIFPSASRSSNNDRRFANNNLPPLAATALEYAPDSQVISRPAVTVRTSKSSSRPSGKASVLATDNSNYKPSPGRSLMLSQRPGPSTSTSTVNSPVKKRRLSDETPETSHLTNTELQRMVLLRQLKLIASQQKYYDRLNNDDENM